jgi:uncharacterized membrane protein
MVVVRGDNGKNGAMESLVTIAGLFFLGLIGLFIAVPVALSRLRKQEAQLAALQGEVRKLSDKLRAMQIDDAKPVSTPVAVAAVAPAPAPAVNVAPKPAPGWPPPAAVSTASLRPSTPPKPPVQSEWQRMIHEFFTGGNLVVRGGIVVLFIGVAFLLKYVAEHTVVPIEFRLAGVAMGAMALLALGWRLRQKRAGFALALQGGAVGVLYLTVFAALRLYHLLPAGGAFALLVVIAAASAALAIKQNSLQFAMLGAAGGFLAPILTSTGQGNHVVLFSYYALLDLGIVAIAWYRAWRPLNLLAFLFTFGIGTAWGVTKYQPDLFPTTEPFLVLYFLIFVGIAILFALRRAPELKHYVDGTLVFGTPVVAMALQSQLVRDIPFARAYSALAAAAIYVGLAAILRRRQQPSLRLLVESFIAVGIAFATLAVPLALDGRWTAATWALEGAAIFWMGLRQQRRLPSISGPALQLAAGCAFLVKSPVLGADTLPFLNSGFIGAVMIAASGLFSARLAQGPSSLLKPWGRLPSNLFLAWGLLWWLVGAAVELQRVFANRDVPGAWLALVTVTAIACSAFVPRLQWKALRVPALLLLPVLYATLFYWRMEFVHPLIVPGGFAWLLALAGYAWILHHSDDDLPDGIGEWLHALAVWLLAAVGGWELSWQVDRWVDGSSSWSSVAVALVPALLVFIILRGLHSALWPMQRFARSYFQKGAGGLLVFLLLWSVISSIVHDGNAAPLPYFPLLNPFDLMQMFALLLGLRWLQVARKSGMPDASKMPLVVTLVAATFVWLNTVLLRTLHHWVGIAYQANALLGSTLVQTSLSIFWTLLALATMLWATRAGRRVAWLAGAALMAVVVAKLFLVDLARVGTVERIVSFIVVGGLMLVIGYFSPLPPTDKEETA